MEARDQTNHAPDEVSVKSWIQKFGRLRRFLVSQWKKLLICILIGGAIGLAYAMLRTTSYKALCTFVLQEGEKSGGGGLGQYSALASMVGIDVGSSSGLFQGDNIIELYKSRLMIEQALLSQAVFRGHRQLLIDRYIQINHLEKAWRQKPALRNLNFHLPKQNFTVDHDSLITMMVDDINKNYLLVSKPDKKLTIINVQVKAPDPLFAKALTESMVSTVNAFYIRTKTKGLVRNMLLLQHQADSVKRALNGFISGTAAALDVYPNANPIMQSLRVPSQKRQVDVQASGAIYAEVVKNLEIARNSLQRETPLIQVIDEPVLPLPNDRLSKSKAILTGMLIALIVSTVVLLIWRGYQGIMN